MDDAKNRATLLTFRLAGDKYALRVSAVEEVLEYVTPTHIPGTSEVLAGVINVRGRVIPVIDLRRRLGLSAEAPTVDTGIIVADVHAGEDQTVGLVVDAVDGVIEVDETEIDSAPRLGSHVAVELIDGIVKSGDAFTILLQAERLVSVEEAESLRSVVDSQVHAGASTQ